MILADTLDTSAVENESLISNEDRISHTAPSNGVYISHVNQGQLWVFSRISPDDHLQQKEQDHTQAEGMYANKQTVLRYNASVVFSERNQQYPIAPLQIGSLEGIDL